MFACNNTSRFIVNKSAVCLLREKLAVVISGRKNSFFSKEYNVFNVEKNPPQDVWADRKDPKYTDVEEVNGHWQYVERLFYNIRINPPPEITSSTGWKAPAGDLSCLPYFSLRSRNHMLPVYLVRRTKDKILATAIRKINGDIWRMEVDLKNYLQQLHNCELETQVNEISCHIYVRGDYVDDIKQWLYDKGF